MQIIFKGDRSLSTEARQTKSEVRFYIAKRSYLQGGIAKQL